MEKLEMKKINELKPGMKANVAGEIREMNEAREITTKFGKTIRVAEAQLGDESGTIKLTLWEKTIDEVKKGDKITIENGWVSEFKGELQISTGKAGKIITSSQATL